MPAGKSAATLPQTCASAGASASADASGIAAGSPSASQSATPGGASATGTPTGTLTEFSIPTVNSQPYGITAGPDGNLWFTESFHSKIGRISVAGAITEFPLFTFIYSDLHAHMLALPLTLLSISWTLSILLARKLSRWSWLVTLIFGGLVIGVLRPTNTWDFPTYLALGGIVTGYAIFRYAELDDKPRFGLAPFIQRIFLAIAGVGVLVGAALLLFQPFAQWYGLAYSEVSQWTNEKTPIWSYWTQWGLFQFVIISWMAWETRQWLAQTPLSALAKLKPYELLIEIGAAAAHP